MKKIKYLLTILVLTLFVVSCGTSKGYLGTTLPDSELAILNGESNNLTLSGKKFKEKVLITKVDSIEVGNYYKGWPKDLKIKPGEHMIEVRHFRPWKHHNTYYGGGAIGGVISGSTNEKNMTHHHYLLKFGVTKSHSYSINIQSKSKDLKNPDIIITDITTGENVAYDFEKKIINKK